MLRALGALALLLGMLAGALWATRRFDLRLPGRVGHRPEQRLELVERLTIDQRRSAVLIRCHGREHLVIVAPEGHVVVSSEEVPAFRSQMEAEAVIEAHAEAKAETEAHVHAQPQAPISKLQAAPCLAALPAGKRARPRRTRLHRLQQNAAQIIEKSEQMA